MATASTISKIDKTDKKPSRSAAAKEKAAPAARRESAGPNSVKAGTGATAVKARHRKPGTDKAVPRRVAAAPTKAAAAVERTRLKHMTEETAIYIGTIAELIAQAADNAPGCNPLIGLQPRDIGAAAKILLKAVAKAPSKAAQYYGSYLKELIAVANGQSDLEPGAKDRRFADLAWKNNFAYKRLLQAYLLTQRDVAAFITSTSLNESDKARALFLANLVFDALAPSNSILGNPAALRKIIDTGGIHLVQGLRNLVHDIKHNHMLPTQVDTRPFKVGENMATSKGQVVLRDDMFELIQYTPTTPQVHKRPLVMAPPQVNKYYAVDLSPDKSLVKWATDSGIQLFIMSWRNPTDEHRHWGLDDYVMALDRAVDAARQITGSDDVNMWGSCSGGMTLAAYLGWLAAQGDRKVVNTTWAVCVLDSVRGLQDSALGLFSTPAALTAAKTRSRRKGMVEGAELARMFAWLRPNDLIWNYWVNNYLLGGQPPAFDILAWNADTTRLPGQFHIDLLDIVEKNPYMNPNTLEIKGVPIDMRQVKVGAYVVGGIADHITPWRGCYSTARLFGDDAMFALANAGHLQSMINPPGTPKAVFAAAPANVDDPDQWAAAAQQQEGSWWPHWRGWIQQRSLELVDAPKKLGSRKYKPLCAAPGTYILED